MSLLVVVLNYRSAPLAIDCLRAIRGDVVALGDARVVVADNDSRDGSAEHIAAALEREDWSGWASCMPLPHNGGFAYGNNAAIRRALAGSDGPPPDYVLLLNPDTVPRPGAIPTLLAFMEERAEVGIAGSRLEYEDGTQHHSRFRFHSILGEVESALRLGIASKLLARAAIAPPLVVEAHPIDWVAGACMLVRREVFESVGLLDEGYFLYYEETDFCLRARRAGWPCWYVPQSRVVHLVGQSSGITNERRRAARRPRYWFESRRRYFVKNHGRVYALAADLAWTFSYCVWRIRRRLQGKPDVDPPHFLADFVRFNLLQRPG